MDITAFLRLAKQFRELGSAVGDQLIKANNGEIDSCNPNALKLCHDLLKRLDYYEVDGALDLHNEIYEAAKEK